MEYQMTIYGKVPSKSNCYHIIEIGGHARLGKTKALTEYEKMFHLQCRYRGIDIKGFFKLEADVFYDTNRPDLDNSLKVTLDCLQTEGVIHNDRYCDEIHVRKFVDKDRPRIEIRITPSGDD